MMRVAVGMSGGVDSSVAAALLKQAGCHVVGVSMLIWEDSKCCSGEAMEDARRVSEILGIEYHVYNLIREFTREVVGVFVQEYGSGRTPNPCPTCNVRLKFHHLWQAVEDHLPVDRIATGHYVRLQFNENLHRYQILKGADLAKDQSYMLYRLSQEQLGRALFPLGERRKLDTRQLARELGLPVADKPDSQDLCFTSGSLAQFLDRQMPQRAKQGPIVDPSGRQLGTHAGIAHYTVGQRKGLGIAAAEPLYVLRLDARSNTVVVGPRSASFADGLVADGVSWLSIPAPAEALAADVKIRYGSNLIPAELIPQPGGTVRVIFDEPQPAVAPGQATVWYQGDLLLGGGTILAAI